MPMYKVTWNSVAGQGHKNMFAATAAKAIKSVRAALGVKHIRAAKAVNFKARAL